MVVRNWHVVDRSQDMLIMEHELFRHIEIEIFVRRSQLAAALAYAVELLRHFSGDRNGLSEARRRQLQDAGLLDELDQERGRYTHQYMICVRRILPDDTLISMTSGGEESWYSLSFISYARPGDRAGFFSFAEQLGKTMAALFQARAHWGKYCPLTSEEVERLYPNLPAFRRICQEFDPQGRFQNSWLKRTLFSPGTTRHEATTRN